MDNRKYEALLHISENGSITKTADELGYTQSGVTQMINSLEKELGIRLLIRTNKGVMLTSNAQLLLPYMREEHRWESRIRQECDRLTGRETGTVVVGCLSSISTAWMPTILEIFAKKYPSIRIHMRENEAPELERMLLSGRIDIAITELASGRGYESKELIKDEIMAVVPPGHVLASRKRISLEELQKYPFVSYSTGDAGAVDFGWPDIATGHRFKWNTMYSCKDDMTAIHMVKHNLGVTIAGSVMLSNYPDETVNISLVPQMFRSLGIAIRSRKDMLPATRSFINCMMDVTSHL
jgi:DNA-binding transcriptional LysR family regulator